MPAQTASASGRETIAGSAMRMCAPIVNGIGMSGRIAGSVAPEVRDNRSAKRDVRQTSDNGTVRTCGNSVAAAATVSQARAGCRVILDPSENNSIR